MSNHYYCENCGEVFNKAEALHSLDREYGGIYAACPNCGSGALTDAEYCERCGEPIDPDKHLCGNCEDDLAFIFRQTINEVKGNWKGAFLDDEDACRVFFDYCERKDWKL